MGSKASLVTLLCALSTVGFAQTGTTTWKYLECQIQFAWTVEESGPGGSLPVMECYRRCKGKKHAKHDACDATCDEACYARQRGHSMTYTGLPGELTKDVHLEELGEKDNEKPKRAHLLSLGDAYRTFGMPSNASVSTAVNEFAKSFKSLYGSHEPYSSNCWSTAYCSTSTAYVKVKRYVLKVDYELTAWDTNSDGKRINVVNGLKGTLRYAISFPPPKNKDREYVYSDPAVACKCEVKQEQPKETGFIPGFRGEEEYAYVEEGGVRRPLTGTDIKQFVTGISVQNMNRAIFEVAAGPFTKCFIPAGWELECTSGDGQDVQLQEDLTLTAMPWPQKIQAFLAPVTLRMLCLEIDEPEPTPSMTYTFAPPARPSLMRLARGVRGSSFRGPWDQMRLWIATDYATYTKIRQILLPTPSRRTYLYEMFIAAQALAFVPSDSRAEAMMETSLLAEPKNDAAAASWLLGTNLLRNGKATADALKNDAAKFHALFDDPEAAPYMAGIAATAANIGTEQAAIAAVRLLTDCVPVAKRAEVAAQESAAEVGRMLNSTSDEQVAKVILDYLEANKPPFLQEACLNVSESLPQSVRERAARIGGVSVSP